MATRRTRSSGFAAVCVLVALASAGSARAGWTAYSTPIAYFTYGNCTTDQYAGTVMVLAAYVEDKDTYQANSSSPPQLYPDTDWTITWDAPGDPFSEQVDTVENGRVISRCTLKLPTTSCSDFTVTVSFTNGTSKAMDVTPDRAEEFDTHSLVVRWLRGGRSMQWPRNHAQNGWHEDWQCQGWDAGDALPIYAFVLGGTKGTDEQSPGDFVPVMLFDGQTEANVDLRVVPVDYYPGPFVSDCDWRWAAEYDAENTSFASEDNLSPPAYPFAPGFFDWIDMETADPLDATVTFEAGNPITDLHYVMYIPLGWPLPTPPAMESEEVGVDMPSLDWVATAHGTVSGEATTKRVEEVFDHSPIKGKSEPYAIIDAAVDWVAYWPYDASGNYDPGADPNGGRIRFDVTAGPPPLEADIWCVICRNSTDDPLHGTGDCLRGAQLTRAVSRLVGVETGAASVAYPRRLWDDNWLEPQACWAGCGGRTVGFRSGVTLNYYEGFFAAGGQYHTVFPPRLGYESLAQLVTSCSTCYSCYDPGNPEGAWYDSQDGHVLNEPNP